MASPLLARAKPKGAPDFSEVPVVLLPALAQFRNAKSTFDILALADEAPDHILAALASHVASRDMYRRDHVRELLRIVGYGGLVKTVGHQRARGMTTRFFEQPSFNFV